MIEIVLVDDHTVVREGLRLLLDQVPDFLVIGEAATAGEAVELVAASTPDVVVMDIALGDDDGVPVIGALRARAPGCRIVILSMFADAETVRQALLAGAAGYVVKGAGGAELTAAIRAVAEGRTFLHSAIANVVLVDGLHWLRTGVPLSPREREVVSLLAGGRSANVIGGALGISTHTVRRHLANAAQKLGLHGSRALSQYAVEHGFARPMPTTRTITPSEGG